MIRLSIAIALFTVLSLQVRAEEKGGGFGPSFLPERRLPPAADVTTDAQLRARQEREKFGGLAKEDKKVRTYDLVTHSTFIQNGALFTIVPKGAVIHLPEKWSTRVVASPTGTFQTWPEFQAANRAWITSFEVTLDQASGKTPLDEAKLTLAKRSGGLIVSVHQGGAISMAGDPTGKPVAKSGNP